MSKSIRIVMWTEKNVYDKKRPDHFGLRYHVDIFEGRKKSTSRSKVFTDPAAADKYAKAQNAEANKQIASTKKG